jgi:hypothetical protein
MTDFCFSRPMLQRILYHAELMDRAMKRVGVDAVVAARLDRGMAWYEARTRCIGCCNERQCRDWLEREDDSSREPPEFCCNAEFFRTLQSRTRAPCPCPPFPPDGGSP